MTLSEAKKKALHLLDEDPASDSAAGYILKFPVLFDMAQREIALVRPIVKSAALTVSGGRAPLPERFYMAERVTGDGAAVPFETRGGDLWAEPDGEYVLWYRALPASITDATPDGSEFEVPAEARDLIPLYAAANAVVAEDQTLYLNLMNQYTNRLMNLASGQGARARVTVRERGAWL